MSEGTQRCYTRSVRLLVDYCGKTPDLIDEDEVQDYFLHSINETKWSPGTMKICDSGIKFFFVNVLKRDWYLFKILRAQPERSLSCVLTKAEIDAVLGHTRTFHNRVYLTTVYSCGLRLQEALHLQVSDIDGER